ncbi:MAG: alpha/beta hydrolase [Prevotella sp.]
MKLETWDESCGRVLHDVAYGDAKEQVYDLYLPVVAHRIKGDSCALMLFVHGGSWMGGDKEWEAYQCKRFAKQGYVCATMNYSLLAKDKPHVTIDTMLDDIAHCIAHLCQHTAALGFPVCMMSLSGQSAGGHLAMLFSYREASLSALPIAFLGIQVGPANLNVLFPDNENADSLAKLSPIHYVSKEAPPAVFAYGGQDKLVSCEHARQLTAAYDSCHVPCRYIAFPHSGHALDNDPDSAKAYFETLSQYASRYFVASANEE